MWVNTYLPNGSFICLIYSSNFLLSLYKNQMAFNLPAFRKKFNLRRAVQRFWGGMPNI